MGFAYPCIREAELDRNFVKDPGSPQVVRPAGPEAEAEARDEGTPARAPESASRSSPPPSRRRDPGVRKVGRCGRPAGRRMRTAIRLVRGLAREFTLAANWGKSGRPRAVCQHASSSQPGRECRHPPPMQIHQPGTALAISRQAGSPTLAQASRLLRRSARYSYWAIRRQEWNRSATSRRSMACAAF